MTRVRDKEIRTELFTTTLSGTRIPRVCLPDYADWGEIVKWTMQGEPARDASPTPPGSSPSNAPPRIPSASSPARGRRSAPTAASTILTKDDAAKRLSTAFDSVTLYGEDPDERPDIYGKVGESGVSICTQDDMDKLFAGFDLCDPMTSVSMTVNGPAPILLAMFFNTAIRQQLEKFRRSRRAGAERR